ncbi:hypothetical protein CesoFtcFv8_010591 [Champsocephalus esox]|uniref:Uncharacterized protein n=1 Tax=Champsocephalus esox TaxID=159716 RepID=A0AAN8C575_9TELE|nr:hypothetical protein CesoFtcFv8_010591 [Champsocephalus esox]
MRVLKDNILQRTKAFNLPQLFDLLTSRLETYYEARIVGVALGRWEAFQRADMQTWTWSCVLALQDKQERLVNTRQQ